MSQSHRAVAIGAALILAASSPPTHVPPAVPASWRSFSTGSTSRLAVLLTDTTALWLPLAHGLRSIGVPFVITRDYHEALRHRVVLVYPTISGLALSADALRALTEFPKTGNTLIAMRWGLIPSWWTKAASDVPPTFNVHARGVTEPFFWSAFKRNRCIIPASGYFEWKRMRKLTRL